MVAKNIHPGFRICELSLKKNVLKSCLRTKTYLFFILMPALFTQVLHQASDEELWPMRKNHNKNK